MTPRMLSSGNNLNAINQSPSSPMMEITEHEPLTLDSSENLYSSDVGLDLMDAYTR